MKFDSKKLWAEIQARRKAREGCPGHKITGKPGHWVCSVCGQKLDTMYRAGYLDRIRHEGGDPNEYIELEEP